VIAGMLIGVQLWKDPEADKSDVSSSVTTTELPNPPTPRATISLPSMGTLADRMGRDVQVGSPAPDFTLPDLHGELQSLSSYRGSVVLINFWTTWCPPCRLEMPALQAAYEKYEQHGFTILAVNWTELDEPDAVEDFALEMGLTFPILMDERGEVSEELFKLRGLPTSVFINGDGIVSEIFIGPLELESIETKIQTIIEEN
jgi:peroxiredoxin